MVVTRRLLLETAGGFAVVNITDQMVSIIEESGIREGSVLIFYQHTTGGVILMEYEAGIMADLEAILDTVAPEEYDYKHHLRGVDFNGHAHIRSSLLGSNLSIPISEGQALLGRYQQLMVIDMQTETESRSVVIQITGE